ncbi:cobyrinate a,c-diamide synthase [Psychromonas sp. Urea-02u-13]|uniref:cobyrinate a,c-diamide synthase n=1 Tax=Psychromonas sp. Urea-02u-13 TaxID=2058326 RepID=UPI000C32DD1B|nr:cobyrinate a,c-diamide synthase [Psychromonas sp. Urea-02u-13]PKG40952.1 cobyrinate a,c-diamide synthase [Psychromonas sp. Urea-02u-13]
MNTNKMNTNMNKASCPALFLAAPASGQGKTTITAAIARYFTMQGKVVRVFKTGPDYLDPQILAQASNAHVEQLDMWMAGENYCQQKLYEAALEADLILVEGAMGLFDGEPSSADLAARFNLPIAIVMDVKGMAQTAGAIAIGLANYRDDYECYGLIANNCSTDRHAQLIREALADKLPLLACLKKDETITLPERHLGLVQASEVFDELEEKFTLAGEWLKEGVIRANASSPLFPNTILTLPAPVDFYATELPSVKPLLKGKTIAIARDRAFSFIYQANTRLLEEMGARLVYFSPLTDTQLPETDALWLPGGYPELYAQQLAQNQTIQQQIQQFYQSDKPVLAECGGFLYCLNELIDLDNKHHQMLGLLAGNGSMSGKRGCQGMQKAILPEGEIHGHAHHRSRAIMDMDAMGYGQRQRHPAPGEPIYRDKKLTASYLHLFFPSNPALIANLFTGQLQAVDKEKLNAWQQIAGNQ